MLIKVKRMTMWVRGMEGCLVSGVGASMRCEEHSGGDGSVRDGTLVTNVELSL